MAKWRCGYLPNDGGGDKRGWSLRGNILYPVLLEQGKVLARVGRDVQYEQKEREYQTLSPAERQSQESPAKHRFPKGFHRGQELFGQHASRLSEASYREFITEHGLILVEGPNDVIGLDNLGVPSLGIMSNRMTEAQGEKAIRFAQSTRHQSCELDVRLRTVRHRRSQRSPLVLRRTTTRCATHLVPDHAQRRVQWKATRVAQHARHWGTVEVNANFNTSVAMCPQRPDVCDDSWCVRVYAT